MNRIYRIVFNRTSGTVQAVAETAAAHSSAPRVRGASVAFALKPKALALACAAAFGFMLAAPAAMAASCPAGSSALAGVAMLAAGVTCVPSGAVQNGPAGSNGTYSGQSGSIGSNGINDMAPTNATLVNNGTIMGGAGGKRHGWPLRHARIS